MFLQNVGVSPHYTVLQPRAETAYLLYTGFMHGLFFDNEKMVDSQCTTQRYIQEDKTPQISLCFTMAVCSLSKISLRV
jgi:hypothetical protein